MDFLDYILQFIFAGIGTAAFALVFGAPRREYVFCMFNGAILWLTYLILLKFGTGITGACIGATFLDTLISRVFSAIRKNPVTVFLITAIFPLVPGAGIYYTAYYLIMGNYAMAGAKGLETFKIAGGIVLGIVFGFVVPQTIFAKLASLSSDKDDARYQKLP